MTQTNPSKDHSSSEIAEAAAIEEILCRPPRNITADRNQGYPETRAKIASGEVRSVAEAVRDLESLKDMVFNVEKQALLKMAKTSLIAGWARAAAMSTREAAEQVEKCVCFSRETIRDTEE